MFKLNEVREQLKKYPNDPACVALVRDLEEYYGYAFDDPDISDRLNKIMDEVQAVYKQPSPVKKQNGLIEVNKRIKEFRMVIRKSTTLTDALKENYDVILERVMIELTNTVLGTNIATLDRK